MCTSTGFSLSEWRLLCGWNAKVLGVSTTEMFSMKSLHTARQGPIWGYSGCLTMVPVTNGGGGGAGEVWHTLVLTAPGGVRPANDGLGVT